MRMYYPESLVGNVYVSKAKGNKRKLRVIEEKEETTIIEDVGASSFSYLECEMIDPEEERGKKVEILQDIFFLEYKKATRQPRCYKCKRDLVEKDMELCYTCGWIICPDDSACGCNVK